MNSWIYLWALAILTTCYLFTLDKAVYYGVLKGKEDKFMIGMAYIGCFVATAGMIVSS